MSMEFRICEHHGDPLFRFRSETSVDGEIRKSEYEFCWLCAGSAMKVTCPKCKTTMPVIQLDDATHVYADSTVRNLSCTICNTIIASADVSGS